MRASAPIVLLQLLGIGALAACGGGGGGASSSGGGTVLTTPAFDNTLAVVVDAGPPQVNAINTLYTTVTICAPGSTTQCQAIDHIQVDTGSTGFRVLAAALGSGLTPAQLTASTDANGKAVVECTQFVDGYSWGPVKLADLKLGSNETAASVPIQVIGDPAFPSSLIPASCINLPNAEEDTVLQFGANGVLGIGNFLQDCGPFCAVAGGQDGSAYNVCTSGTGASCAPAAVALTAQVANPVAFLKADGAGVSDANGVIVELPTLAGARVAGATGTLVFGIGTRSNNGLGSATVYTLDANAGTLTTVYRGTTLTRSFVDSGSNGNYFPDSTIATCSDQAAFFCPAAPLALSAQMQGGNGRSATISFSVASADQIPAVDTIALDLAGPAGSTTTRSFDWGLPFFFGRNLYVAFENTTLAGNSGPSIAF
jgi:hypothetical protein